MELLLLLAAQPAVAWVIFSPVRRTLQEKSYEDNLRQAWKGPDTFNLELVSLRWGLPQSAHDSDDGLASGITFALHRNFCDRMLPLFPEAATSSFITCTELQDTVKRAMDTWAINHKKIYFRDVTEDCADVIGLKEPCPAAELFIVPDVLGDAAVSVAADLAAYVTHNTQTIDFNPYTTAGYRLNPGLGVRDVKMTLRAPLTPGEFCWYLDTTFCYGFHRYTESGTDVMLVFRIVGAIIFAISLLLVICICLAGIQATMNDDRNPVELRMPTGGTMMDLNAARASQVMRPEAHGDLSDNLECGSKRLTNLVDFLSVMPTFLLIFATFFVIFIPMFYFRIFVPCWDCYDFEATIAHEVGHVLGFHHPDAEWELNLNAKQPMGPATCERALDYVYLNKTKAIKDSIMFSMTTHRDRTCLTPDDLEGLNFLYPSCSGAATVLPSTGQPKCIKAFRYTGWLRLIISVMLPWLIVSALSILLQYGLRFHQRKRLKSLELVALKLRKQRSILIKKVNNRASVAIGRKSVLKPPPMTSASGSSVEGIASSAEEAQAPVKVRVDSAGSGMGSSRPANYA